MSSSSSEMEFSYMQKHRRLIGLRQLLDEDLDAVCADLTAEFGALSGGRLLVTGGGGFLGYYLVQSVLHWNDKHARRRQDRSHGV